MHFQSCIASAKKSNMSDFTLKLLAVTPCVLAFFRRYHQIPSVNFDFNEQSSIAYQIRRFDLPNCQTAANTWTEPQLEKKTETAAWERELIVIMLSLSVGLRHMYAHATYKIRRCEACMPSWAANW